MSVFRLNQVYISGVKRVLRNILMMIVYGLFILNPVDVAAQSKVDSFKQYRQAFGGCEEHLRKGKLDKAIGCYDQLRKKYPSFIRSYVRLAELYYQRRDNQQTLLFANKAIDMNPNEAYSPLTYLCNKMNSNGDHQIAMLIMNRLSVSEVEPSKKSKVEAQKLNYTLRSSVDRSPVPGVDLQNMGDSINTSEHESLPTISLDGRMLVFTRRVGGNEDFFVSYLDSNGIWSGAVNLGYPPNTGMPDGAAMISADGYYLFYTRCDMPSPDGIVGGGCDLVFSYREGDTWSSPQYFGFTINTTGYEGQPCISSDNRDLYFVSNREGGFGGMDIWVSRFKDNYWSKPENLGPSINTDKNETSPFIHPDNETLYFASDGHPGLGQTDLFISRQNKNGTWKRPINLGAPINTDKFDGSIVINAKGTKGIISSDRSDSKGGLDLYSFDTYPAIQPIPTLCLKGFLRDKFDKKSLYERPIYFTQLLANAKIGEQLSNEGDASFSQALQLGKTYMISVLEDGYRPYYKKINLNTESLPDNLEIDIHLKQPGLIDTLVSTVLFSDTLSMDIDSQSRHVLDSLFNYWSQWTEDSAYVRVMLKGYYYSGDTVTDSLFAKSIEDCQKRLNAVEIYFKQKGVPCEFVMHDMDMLIYSDEQKWYRCVEMAILEYY